jgi:hypothetical protein
MKHNKKRNTAFIYETLARELTKTMVEKDRLKQQKLASILKEYFSRDTILAKELELYNVLLETVNVQQKIAERLLEETKIAYTSLNENTLFTAQSKLIAVMNKELGKEVWGNFIPNFKSLASVSAIFSSKVGVKKRVLFEQIIVDRMCEKREITQEKSMKPLDSLTYNSFIKKFNSKYTDLMIEQKDLLNQYITSFADDGFELRLYLNEELSRLKSSLANTIKSTPDSIIVQKVNEVSKYLDSFQKREFTETDLNKVLKTQQLVRELSAND